MITKTKLSEERIAQMELSKEQATKYLHKMINSLRDLTNLVCTTPYAWTAANVNAQYLIKEFEEIPTAKKEKSNGIKTAYYLLNIEERNNGQEYTQPYVISFEYRSNKSKAFIKAVNNTLKGWYAEEKAKREEQYYTFFNGDIWVTLKKSKELTKQEFDLLNRLGI